MRTHFRLNEALRASSAWLLVALLVPPLLAFGAFRVARAPDDLERELLTKGDVELLVYARRGQFVVLLDRFNRAVQPGEEIRFILTGVPDEHSHVLIASVDGAGAATIYFPFEGTSSAPVPGPGRWEVPGSIVLDESLGPERVFALFSSRPLAVADVKDALLALGRAGHNAIRDARTLALRDTTQRSFLMFKQARHAR
jgi:hypothetical protein